MRALRQQISELQIDKALKHQLLEVINEKKRYGLVWEDSSEEAYDRMQEELPVFMEDAAKRLDSAPVGSPNHVLIEGDNLNALAALSYTHAGKIDVIYIDPPYNTGNKDFSYNDDFVDIDDGFRHSKWLSFMYRRLKIAKELLSEKGVIFISIDDNEQAALKMMCDDVFGEEHFIGSIVWFKKRKGSFLSNKLVSLTEYILPYSKGDDTKLFGGLPDNTESQPIIKRTNSKKILSFKGNVVKSKLPNGIYRAGSYGSGSSASRLLNDVEIRDGLIITPFEIEAPFVWGQVFVEQEMENGTEFFINTKNFQVRVIRHNNTSVKAFPSFLDGRSFNATNEDAYELLKAIFNEDSPFRYSKPVNLIAKILQANSYEDKDITILDFFAGSGTTLHATMQLNAEDGGHRKCILVTNNENNICENVTYERNKRVIQGYTTPKGEQVAGLADNNLRYYRTAFVPREHSNRNRRNLMSSLVDVLCIKNDIYKEEETFGGERFKPSVLRYFKDEAGQMLIVLDERVVSTIVPMIADVATKDNPLKVYVYSDGAYAYEDEFREVLPVIDLCAMPDAYLQALQSSDALPEHRYSEETMAEFNASNATATQDKEAVAAALSDTYDYVNE